MKKSEKKSNNNIKREVSSDNNEVKSFLILVVILAVLIGVVYGVTEFFKDDEVESTPDSTIAGVVDYDGLIVGNMLNRPYDEYYVLAYNFDNANSVLYSTLMTNYMSKKESKEYIKIYYCDLDNQLNSKYVDVNDDGVSNPSATTIDELDFGELTLIKIKDGKIVNYVEDYAKIKDLLDIELEEES